MRTPLHVSSKPSWRTYTAVRGVLDPPEPAPSMLNIWPPLFCLCIILMASRVHIIEPIKFVETIYTQYHRTRGWNSNNYRSLSYKNVQVVEQEASRRGRKKKLCVHFVQSPASEKIIRMWNKMVQNTERPLIKVNLIEYSIVLFWNWLHDEERC